MIVNARYQTGPSLSPPMDYSCARVALLEAQLSPDRLLYYHQAEQQGLPDSSHMDYIDFPRQQYKHHHHHHHIQQQVPQHHHPHPLPVAGSYVDFGGGTGFVIAEGNSVSFDALSHLEKEKQAPPQNHYVDQYGGAGVQASYKPVEDAFVSVKTHEDSLCPSKACEDAHGLLSRHENLHFACDRGYAQHHLHSPVNPSPHLQARIRLLCSIGGRIMGRPVDGKLRYCGGDTRLITVERGICFSDLMVKLTQLYGSPVILKYQLPGEDLDALVSVSSDDDLQNMVDEYDKLVASGGSSWFRLFLFKLPSDCDIYAGFIHESRNCCAEVMQRYVDAINGTSELPTDVHLDSFLNDRYPSSRFVMDGPNTTLAGSCFSAKPASRGPSAPSSLPSSPSLAARQTRCKHCGIGNICPQLSKDQQSFVAPMSGIDISTREFNQDRLVDALKSDHHQSQIPGEGPRIQHDSTFSRGDSLWAKENGAYVVDSHDILVHPFERHRGTGTIHMDAVLKPSGTIDSQCETCCGSHSVAQQLTSHVYQAEDDFGRVEPAHHCYVEGHKQIPILHQSHQVGSPVHREGLIRVQRGPAIDLGFPDGSLPFSQEPMHPLIPNSSAMSSVPCKALGSAPSSPKDVSHGRCCCCLQHLQVDRGINVSLGEHSYSKKPAHFGEQSIRRHGLPLLSRFCDGSNACFDTAAWHCPQTLGKGLEFDELEHGRSLKRITQDRINTWSHLNEGGAKESASPGFVEPVQGVQERSLHRCRYCCLDFNDLKGQQAEKATVFPVASEFQAYMGESEARRASPEESLNVSTMGRLYDQKTDLNVERGNDTLISLNFNHGQVDLETRILNVQDGCDVSGYAHMRVSNPSSMLGHQESGHDLKSESFSSTDAVAGSLSRSPVEPPIWVAAPPGAVYEDHLKEVEVRECAPPVDSMASIRQLVDGINSHEATGDACRSPSFSRMDSYARHRSGDGGECHVENSPVSSLVHMPEDKINISYAHGSQPNFDHFCSASSSQPFTSKTLESGLHKGSITLASPIYDQSPVSSVDNATFSFAQNEEKSSNNGKEVLEQCVDSRSTLTPIPYQSVKQHEEIAKAEVEAVAHKVSEQQTISVLEEVKSLSLPSCKQCSVETGNHDKVDVPLKNTAMAKSSTANKTLQEVNASGSTNICTEDDEKELPATQAEAEAISRGLQIIKNDDLEDLKELGSGTYGTVFHGKWRGSDVAIKRIKASCFMGRPSMQERLISDFWREAATLSQLHHPNIVAFYGVVPDGPGGTLATVTEYMVNGSLKQVLVKKDRTIDRRKRLLIAMDAAFGMEYLHSKRIVHFDLKSENLLVNMRDAHRPVCKVGDFGLSKVKHQTLVSGGVRGTLPWMAPELLSGKGLVTEKVDVYSFGIVMWELLTGEEPYANMHCGTIIGGIANDNLRPAIPSFCDPSWRDLMERCWSGNPADRPDFATVASELRAIASSMNIK